MGENPLQPFADAPLPVLTPEARLKRTAEAAFQTLDGETVIVLPLTRTLHVLNGTGGLLWERLVEPRTVSELVTFLAEVYAVDLAAAEKDVLAWAAELKRQRILVDA